MITMTSLDQSRLQLLLDLASKTEGRVTPKEFLSAVDGKQKMILNILWLARRCGYVAVEQVREGRKIAYWDVKVTGKCPNVKGDLGITKVKIEKKAKESKQKVPQSADKIVKQKASKPAKAAASAEIPVVNVEKIKAANLAKMKAVSAKIAKKAAASKKKTIVIDEVEKELGSSGEIATSFAIDNGFDSMEGINVRDFLR
jgi:hypothetical protein